VRASAERALAPLRREGDQLPFELTRELKDAMWEGAGVVRDRAGLEQARDRLEDLGERLAAVAVPGGTAANPAWQETLDLANQLTVARVIVASALAREESRGAHYRADHPEQDDARWLRVAVARRGDDDAIELGWQPVDFTRARPAVAEAAP
jgi:succinate dehydrogenase/fumarate reductase flavoprotein subunit